MALSEKKRLSTRKAQAKYDGENTKHVGIKLNIKTDADILEALEKVPKKQTFIKEAIRFYLAHSEDK